MTPLALVVAILVLQVGAVLWTMTSTTEAARQGARVVALGGDGCDAAQAALPSRLEAAACSVGPPATLRLSVGAPRVSDLLPPLTVTREAVLP